MKEWLYTRWLTEVGNAWRRDLNYWLSIMSSGGLSMMWMMELVVSFPVFTLSRCSCMQGWDSVSLMLWGVL